MIKQLAWNTFKNTGNINTFMEFIQFKNMEESLNSNNIIKTDEYKVNDYGDNKDQGISNIGKQNG